MYYVYLIKSQHNSGRKYIGFTRNIEKRIEEHNKGESPYTRKYVPWELVSFHAFADKRKAQEFEYYLKTGSGQAFASKRFW